MKDIILHYENSFIENFDVWQKVVDSLNNLILVNYIKLWPVFVLVEGYTELPEPDSLIPLTYDDFCRLFLKEVKRQGIANIDTETALINMTSTYIGNILKDV